jgi:hypothetical protein
VSLTVEKGGAWIGVAVGAAILALFDLAIIAVTILAVVRYGVHDGAEPPVHSVGWANVRVS